MKPTHFTVLLFSALFANSAIAQLTPPVPQPVIGARQPSLSADGKQLAFLYRGDIWSVTASGGKAVQLTTHVEMDSYPLFSPDGNWIAFASKRSGNYDLFLVPASGGTVRQLTWNSGAELPTGWSPDSKRVIFSAQRNPPNQGLYSVDISTHRTELLCEDFASLRYGVISKDATTLAYARHGMPWYRPRYHGAAASQLWTLETATGKRRALTTNSFQHLWPQFLPDGKSLVAVTVGERTRSATHLNEPAIKLDDNPARTPNLWAIDLAGRSKQITTFTGDGVRCPTVAAKSGDIAFEYDTDIWFLKSGEKTPKKLQILADSDSKQNQIRSETHQTGVTESEPSPDGKLMAFGIKGDIWTIPNTKPKGDRSAEIARRLTQWVGDDSDFTWGPDSKKLYFVSDRENNSRLYEMDLANLQVRPLWARNEEMSFLKMSPDGKQASFWVAGKEGGLYLVNVADGTSRRLVNLPGINARGVGGSEYNWSPDQKWIAYVRRSSGRGFNIWIVPTAGGEPVNVTRLNAAHSQPVWSPDGKWLLFQSNRDGEGIYSLPLKKEGARIAVSDAKHETPASPVKVEIDFEDIHVRIRKVTSQSAQSDLSVTSAGLIHFIAEGDVWSLSFDGREVKRLTTGGGKVALRLLPNGQQGSIVQSGEMHQINLSSGGLTKVTFTAERQEDTQATRRAAFTQFWREYHHRFYDGNFHGRDWNAIRTRYEKRLPSVENKEEFATLLQMMVGELDTSHSEVSSTDDSPRASTPHLGFTFDHTYAGPGLKVQDIPLNSPLSFEKTILKPGEFILGINGQNVTAGEKLFEWLNDQKDRDLEILVSTNSKSAGTRVIRYKPISLGAFEDLHYRQRTQQSRKRVETESGGKVGYLHIPAMSLGNQVQFEKEAYEYIQGKDAIIFDVRFNRGGNISDNLIDMLERKQHGIYRTRDEEAEPAPDRPWSKPVIVLMNEHSYSNGEMFPYAMRQRGLARIVGMPTPGYVIWTGNFQLIDGTSARLPGRGVYRMDNTNMEADGEKPDVQIPFSPDDWFSGKDPQLDKAIEMLIKKP